MTNFEYKLDRATAQLTSAQSDAQGVLSALEYARQKTAEVLAIAESVGTTAISIGMKHPIVNNEDWPFGASGSIFTPLADRVNGWPSAWRIAEKAGISAGAGNSGQHQTDNSQLVDGVYELRDGAWQRIDLAAE